MAEGLVKLMKKEMSELVKCVIEEAKKVAQSTHLRFVTPQVVLYAALTQSHAEAACAIVRHCYKDLTTPEALVDALRMAIAKQPRISKERAMGIFKTDPSYVASMTWDALRLLNHSTSTHSRVIYADAFLHSAIASCAAPQSPLQEQANRERIKCIEKSPSTNGASLSTLFNYQ